MSPTKTKSKTTKATRSAAAKKATTTRRRTASQPQSAKPNPDPGPMPTNESLNPDATKGTLKLKHPFRAGEEVAFWPASLVSARQLKGEEPMRTPFASATVLEDGTIDATGLGKGSWVIGGPAGYPIEERFHKVTVK